MEQINLPTYVTIVFVLTTLLTFLLLLRAISKVKEVPVLKVTIGVVIWVVLQAVLSYFNIYLDYLTEIPPLFLLNIVPPMAFIVYLFNSSKGKSAIDKFDLVDLTLISIVRIPVEFVLLWLAVNKLVPEELTFEGRNFDILSGITAVFVAFAFVKEIVGRKVLLVWNIGALILLVLIVSQAVLSLPTPFQQIGLEQPNIGVLLFPFNWLPAFVVPVVFFSHFVSIRQLVLKKE